MVVLRDIRFESHCEHHMLPIIGRAHVAYLPTSRVVGISKLARVVEAYAKRLQIQEKLTAQIANTVNEVLRPQGGRRRDRGRAPVHDDAGRPQARRHHGDQPDARQVQERLQDPAGIHVPDQPPGRFDEPLTGVSGVRPGRSATAADGRGVDGLSAHFLHRRHIAGHARRRDADTGRRDAAARGPDWLVFLASAFPTLFVGGAFVLMNRSRFRFLGVRQAFVLTTMSWIVIAAFGALPFVFSDLDLTYTDAFFEAMSGITTTGSTVVTGLDSATPGILLWRALLQWLGGIGIVVMAIAVLPMLRVGGMQLFHMESSDRSGKTMPRAAQISTTIAAIYFLLTAVCFAAYWVAGMPPFDAVAHSMTTIATGGFSTSDASLGRFPAPAIHWIAVCFMILGACRSCCTSRPCADGWPPSGATPRCAGSAASRSSLRRHVLLALAGGRRTVPRHAPGMRLQRDVDRHRDRILDRRLHDVGNVRRLGVFPVHVRRGMRRFHLVQHQGLSIPDPVRGPARPVAPVWQPHGVFIPSYNRKPLDDSVIGAVMVFFFLFVSTFAALALILAAIGLDFVTSVSGAATAIANVGPALGDVIGPAGTFATLPDSAKWALSAGMLLGRLELLTVLVLFTPGFWRA